MLCIPLFRSSDSLTAGLGMILWWTWQDSFFPGIRRYSSCFGVLMKVTFSFFVWIYITLHLSAKDGAQEILVLKQMIRKNQTAFETRKWRWTKTFWDDISQRVEITSTLLISEKVIMSDKMNTLEKVRKWNATKHTHTYSDILNLLIKHIVIFVFVCLFLCKFHVESSFISL